MQTIGAVAALTPVWMPADWPAELLVAEDAQMRLCCRQLRQHLGRAVGGAIVDDDDLVRRVCRERSLDLGNQRGEVPRLVARGNYYGQPGHHNPVSALYRRAGQYWQSGGRQAGHALWRI